MKALFVFSLLVAVCIADPLADAFELDGYNMTSCVTINGNRGCIGESKTIRVLSTGAPKRAYYVEGSASDMGYLMGRIAEPVVTNITIEYLDRFVVSLLDKKFNHKYENETWYNDLIVILGDFVVKESNKAFAKQYAEGNVFPEALVSEMRGMVKGCQEANPQTQVTFERVVATNFAMDWLSTHIFAGKLLEKLRALAVKSNAPPALLELLETTQSTSGMIKPPAYCDAFCVKGSFTKESTDVFFARDFQLATGDVLQDYISLAIYNPSDERSLMVAVFAPGLVGSITVMNEHGFAMGVDTLRSQFGDTDAIGLGSALMLRHVGHNAKSVDDAIDIVAESQRGCPWLYPMCDSSGGMAVIEAGPSVNISGSDFNPLKYADPLLYSLLPNASFIQEHSSAALFNKGLYVRTPEWNYPTDYFSFNKELFAHSKTVYDPSAFLPDGQIFDHWQQEKVAVKALQNNYFTPSRTGATTNGDLILVSNLAIVPEARIMMMSLIDDVLSLSNEAPQWRYDSLHKMITQDKGAIDFDKAKEIITFLSPDRTPGYWNMTLNPDDPMSAQIEGAIAVCNLTPGASQQMWLRAGYWCDGWTHVTLTSYKN